MNTLTELIQDIASRLKQKNWQIATAESCTGGLIAAKLTELPGSSLWFERGFVTYSNLSKYQMLGVSLEIIDKFGAVSEEVAAAMAHGALLHSKAHISLSVTGIAGPKGGSLEKPVGTVCFGWVKPNMSPLTLIEHFSGNRQSVRRSACQQALEGLLSLM